MSNEDINRALRYLIFMKESMMEHSIGRDEPMAGHRGSIVLRQKL